MNRHLKTFLGSPVLQVAVMIVVSYAVGSYEMLSHVKEYISVHQITCQKNYGDWTYAKGN